MDRFQLSHRDVEMPIREASIFAGAATADCFKRIPVFGIFKRRLTLSTLEQDLLWAGIRTTDFYVNQRRPGSRLGQRFCL